MVSRLIETIICPACGAELPPSADACPRCASPTSIGSTSVNSPQLPSQSPSAAAREQRTSLLDRPWFIVGLLFLVTAILGLPLLWASRGFSRLSKFALSVAVTLYTAALLWGFCWIMHWSWSRILDSLR